MVCMVTGTHRRLPRGRSSGRDVGLRVTEHLDQEAVWAIWERPDSETASMHCRLDRPYVPGEVFKIPNEGGFVPLTLGG